MAARLPLGLIVLAIAGLALPGAAAALTATTTTLTASPNPTTAGTPVTLTGTATVSGTLTFVVDGVTVGTATARATSAATPGTEQYIGGQTSVNTIYQVAFDAAGNEYFAMGPDTSNSGGGRRMTPSGTVNTFATNIAPTAITVSSTGLIYEIASGTLYKRTAYNAAATSFVTGLGNVCTLSIDASDNVYSVDNTAGTVTKITPAGVKSTYATGLTSPCGSVMNKTTGVLYVYATGGLYQIPSGGGTPTLFAATTCVSNANLAIDDVGYIYAKGCGAIVNQFSPSGTKTAYLSAVTAGTWTTAGQNSRDLGWADGKIYINGWSIDGAARWVYNPSGFSATATYTPATAGLKSASASLAPTNTGTFGPSSGTRSITVTPTTPSAPDLAASSDLGSSATDNLTSDATPTMSVPGTYVDGAVITLTATRSGATAVTCSYTLPGQTSCDLPTMSAGTWTITATQTIGGATSAASSGLSVTIDTTAPSTPTGIDLATASDTGTSSTDNVTRTATPTMSAVGGAANDTMTITLTAPGVSYTCSYVLPAANCAMPTLPDGTYTATARLTDPAGNQSAVSSSITVRISTPPAAPTAIADQAYGEQGRAVETSPLANDTAGSASSPLSVASLKLCRPGTDTPPSCTQTSVLITGKGTFAVNATTGVVTFTPLSGWVDASNAISTAIDYVMTDGYTDVVSDTPIPSRVRSATITVTLLPPPAMAASPDTGTSSGYRVAVGIDPLGNDSAGTVPPAYTTAGAVAADTGTLKLCQPGETPPGNGTTTCASTSVAITGQGTYSLSGTTVTFTPLASFQGTASGVGYRICNAVTGTWAPTTPSSTCGGSTVTAVIPAPATPAATADTPGTAFNTATSVDVLANDTKDANLAWGSVRLCLSTDTPPVCAETTLTVAGQGTFVVDDATKRIGFTPAANYQGTTSTVRYVVLDELGQTASSTLAVNVVASTIPFDVDLAAASDSGASSADDVTNDITPTVSAGGGSAGNTMTLTATKGPLTVSCSYVLPAPNCTLPPMEDGVWTVTATLTNSGVVSSASPPLSLTIDSTGPSGLDVDLAAASDSGSSSTDDATSDTTPTFTVPGQATGDAVTISATPSGGGAAVTCSYTVGTDTGCTLPALADGTWSVSATITDPAGNTGTAGPLPVTIDTTAPAAPGAPDLNAASDRGSSSTDDLTADDSPRIDVPGGTTGDTMTVTATPVGGGSAVTCTYVVGQATGCDLPGLADGQWALSATRTDPAGNVSPSTPGPSITIDTVPPGAPSAPDLAAASDTGPSATDDATADATPRIDVPGGTAGDTITVTATPADGGAPVSCSFVVGQATGCDLPAMGDGAWTLSSTATDPAGNVSPATPGPALTIDTTGPTAPAAPVLDPASDTGRSNSDSITTDTTPTMRVPGATAGDTITLTATGPNGQTATCSFVASATVDSCDLGPLADGAWSVVATSDAVDPAGNRAAPSAPSTLTIDTAAPAAPGAPKPTGPVSADPDGVPRTDDRTPSFTAPGATAPNTVTLTAVGPDGRTVTCSYVPSATVSSCTLGPLTEGLWTVTPTQTSPAGITGPAGPPYTIRIGGAKATPTLLPPDPVRVDVTPSANGSGYDATAWFAVPVNPRTVIAVVFVIRDRQGRITATIRKPVTGTTDKVRIRIDTLPKGSRVSAYTVNRHGASPKAPRYANLRNVDTRRNRSMLPNGGYALRGTPIGDAVLFEGASAELTPAARAELDRIAAIAKRRGGELLITGFARRNGINSDGWLLRLSKRRAETVARYLADRGVRGWLSWNGVGAATPYVGVPEDRNVQVNWVATR